MSRIRFHTIRGISSYLEENNLGSLEMSGPGFMGWDDELDCQQNIEKIGFEPDMVIGFKPFELKNFKYIKAPKCIRYNEMYDTNWTADEILGSYANLVICHHYNDYVHWNKKVDSSLVPYKFKFDWVPHSIDTEIFSPLDVAKDYDVVILGATHVKTMLGEHYPLRARMTEVLKKMPAKYKCAVLPHVGGLHNDSYTDRYMYDFANKINNAKILVTCSGAPKSRFGKYLEASACGTAVAGDVYDDHPDDVKELKKFLIEIDMSMSDEEIINTLVNHLENEQLLQEKIENGLNYMKNFGLPQYAERFVKIVKDFLEWDGNVQKNGVNS